MCDAVRACGLEGEIRKDADLPYTCIGERYPNCVSRATAVVRCRRPEQGVIGGVSSMSSAAFQMPLQGVLPTPPIAELLGEPTKESSSAARVSSTALAASSAGDAQLPQPPGAFEWSGSEHEQHGIDDALEALQTCHTYQVRGLAPMLQTAQTNTQVFNARFGSLAPQSAERTLPAAVDAAIFLTNSGPAPMLSPSSPLRAGVGASAIPAASESLGGQEAAPSASEQSNGAS